MKKISKAGTRIKDYVRHSWKLQRNSLCRNTWVSMLFDVLYYFLFFAIISIFLNMLSAMVPGNVATDMMTFQRDMLDAEKIDIYQKSLFSFLVKSFFLSIILVLVLSLVTGIFKGIIWDTIRGKEIVFGRYPRYALLTLFYVLTFMISLPIVLLLLRPPFSYFTLLVFLLLILHASIIGYHHMSQLQKVWRSYKMSWKSISRMNHQLVPYMMIIILSLIAVSSSWLFYQPVKNVHNGAVISTILASIILIGVFAWGRLYIMQTVEK